MEVNGEAMWFYPKETARNYIVKHLGKGVTSQELFTEEVWTEDVLKQINEKCIKPKFSYGIDSDETPEIENFLEGIEDAE